MPQTLNDYYTAKGQALPSIADRANTFQSLGLGAANSYAGTAQQNTLLLQKLATPAPTPSTPAATVATGTPTPGAPNPLPGQTQAGINPPAPTPGTPVPGAPNPLPGQVQQGITPAPPISPINNPVVPPTTNTTGPTLPAAQAPNVANNFNTSLATTIQTQAQQLQQSLTTQTQNYQSKIDTLNQQKQDMQALQESGLATEQDITNSEAQDKAAALEQEKKQFEENYNARQQLVGTLTTLLSKGQAAITELQNTSGLSSIMNPRISQTMASVQGQAGVITAALAAYDTQIGLAQSQLKTATDAISQIYGDQLSYWKTVVDFYSGQEKGVDTQIASLSKDQQTYIDAQVKQLQDNVAQTQATAKIVSDAMLDPTKALAYAKAGVSLTDSPAQINEKLATYEQAQQNVWGTPKLVGGDYIQTNKLTGETRTVVSNVSAGTNPAAPGQNYSKGTMSAKQFVELSLERSTNPKTGKPYTYQEALGSIPAGKVGVIDNATGQVGSILPTEYNTKQYTYL